MLDTLGNLLSSLGFCLGLLYAIGLTIVTIHLNRYGITHIYLVQTKYLVVGFIYLLHVIGMGLLSAPIVLAAMLGLGARLSGYLFVILGLLGLIALLFFGYAPSALQAVLRRLSAGQRTADRQSNLPWRIWYTALYCSFLLAWYSMVRALSSGTTWLMATATLLLGLVVISGLVYYVLFLYQAPIAVGNPALELIGTGRPIPIRLTVASDAAAGLQHYNIFSAAGGLSAPVLLLDETESDFIVLVHVDATERALKLSKSIVQSVIYLP